MVAESLHTPLLWSRFTSIVLAMPVLDPGVSHCRPYQIRMREALLCTAAWLAVPLAVNRGACFWFGLERALHFITGCVIEKTSSVDRISGALFLITPFKLIPQCSSGVPPEWNPPFRLIQRLIPSVTGCCVPPFTTVENRGVLAPPLPPGKGAPAAATSVWSPHHRSIPHGNPNHESRPTPGDPLT